MKTFVLNGGNYGAVSVEVADTVTVIAVKSSENEFWMYDNQVHPNTATADFVGMTTSDDSRLALGTTHQVDFQGA